MSTLVREWQKGHVRWFEYSSGLRVPEIECAAHGCDAIVNGVDISPFDTTLCWDCCPLLDGWVLQVGARTSLEFEELRRETGRFLEGPETLNREAIARDEMNKRCDRRGAVLATRAKGGDGR